MNHNLPIPSLLDIAIKKGEGIQVKNGAFVVTTGTRTGRSPADRFLVDDDIREEGGSKSYKGEHRFFDMIHQQIEFVKTLEPKFYFMSRQRKNTRWLKWYFDKFNKQYDANLVVSDEQYRVCNGSNYDCCQTLIYPKEMKIPFEKLL